MLSAAWFRRMGATSDPERLSDAGRAGNDAVVGLPAEGAVAPSAIGLFLFSNFLDRGIRGMTSNHTALSVFTRLPAFSLRLRMLMMVTALAALTTGGAQAQECSDAGSQKSTQAGGAVELSFRNASSEGRRLYWVDENGDRKFVAPVASGALLRQPTTHGHVWIVTDDAEKCLTVITAGAEPKTIEVGAPGQLAVPAPGLAEPIAPAAPQAAPPAEPPVVSPVEQFELSSPQRIAPRSAATRSLDQQASGAVQLSQVRPTSESGRWTFVAVPGTPYVRIRNGARNAYLTDVDGRPRGTLAALDVEASHWTFEPVDGSIYVQMRNRATDRFLLSVNGAAALVQGYSQDQETSSHWEVSPASNAVAAAPSSPPPRDTAYEAYEVALDDCRAIGGYWTGSSCRSPVISRPLACPRGWAWYPEFGECLWEGRCPPWQMGAGGTCLSDLSCKNGRVRMSVRGYPVCDCPPGMRTWGRYPRMACIPSVARIAPAVPPAAGGGQVIGGPGRLPVRPPNPQILRPVSPAVVVPAPAPSANSLSSAAARAAQQRLQAERIRQQNEQRARERREAAQQAAALRAAKLKAERERAAALRKAAAEKAAADRAAAAARATPVVRPRPVIRPVICRPPLKPNGSGGCAP